MFLVLGRVRQQALLAGCNGPVRPVSPPISAVPHRILPLQTLQDYWSTSKRGELTPSMPISLARPPRRRPGFVRELVERVRQQTSYMTDIASIRIRPKARPVLPPWVVWLQIAER